MSRDQAAQSMMNVRKKKAFVIKTSVQQTKFSKKDIKDLKSRFEKHSTWVLVNDKGDIIETEQKGIENEDQQKGKQQMDREGWNNSNQGNNLTVLLRNKSTSQSPNTSALQDKPQAKMTIKLVNYKKVDINQEQAEDAKHGIHYVRKMPRNQFRLCMGLLGLESNAFLSDRIFDVVDSDGDSYINFAQFATIMDTLINGEEDEKHEFSFALLDVYDTGYFDFEEFREIISKIIAHWCIITGSQVKVEREGLKEIFDRMDVNKDGIVDVDEYKQALKGNPGLFQWFDLLNQGIQDGKKTQKDIVNLKVKALTDVLELQQKISTVMTQMKTIDLNQNQHRGGYVSSKQSSSQMSNFGSSYSRPKRQSIKFEDLYSPQRKPQNQQNIVVDDEKKDPRENLTVDVSYDQPDRSRLRQLLDPNPLLKVQTPKLDDLSGTVIQNDFTFSYLRSESTTFDQAAPQQIAKKAIRVDSYQYQIMELKRLQEIQRYRKREYGEKKAQISIVPKKASNESDTDVIEDPDSPKVNKKHNVSKLGSRFKSKQETVDQMQEILDRETQINLFGRSRVQKQSIAIRTPSPLLKLNQWQTQNQTNISQGIENEYKSRNKSQNQEPINRPSSNNSGNSQMKPENQQSTQVHLFNSSALGERNKQKQSRNNQLNNFKTYTRQESQNPSVGLTNLVQNNGYSSDWSPCLTQDVRSEITHAQGGGPINTSQIITKPVVYEKPLSELNTISRRPRLNNKSKTRSFIDEIMDQHSGTYQLQQENEQLKAQQQQIMKQLNDMQTLASHLLGSLQEDQDSAIGEQIKEYVEKQKSKLLEQDKQNDEEDKEAEEETQLHRISLKMDTGNLRPLNEIQTFFKVRSRQRLHESLKKANHIHKPLSNQNKSFIHIGHDNWNLVLHMMLGIRQSVRNVMHEEVFELIEQDFERKYCYELVAKKTKNMNLFEFYDFSPRVFHLIRTMYGITPDSYLKSIGPENLIGNLLMGNISSLKEQCSTGKSGSFFYYTADSNFMLKTISAAEFHNLRDHLKEYYDHLAMYPHTLITRFFGLHKIKYSKTTGGKVRIYFVIMANVFKTSRDINVRFDLKGSTQGRKTKKTPDEYVDPSVALKDLDFLEEKFKVKVTPDIQKALKQQMIDDVRLFQKLNINDYSLLLGIHNLTDEQEARQILHSSPSIHQIIRNSFDIFASRRESGMIDVTYNSQKLLRPPIPFYEAHDGGIVSSDGKHVYFIGIIDTLTYFGAKKKLEYRFKSVAYGNKTISCIPPKKYGERFLGFMNNIFE